MMNTNNQYEISEIETLKYYGECWRDEYPSEMDIDYLFKQTKINQKLVSIESKTTIGENRIALSITTRDSKYEPERRIYMDIISGAPTWEQFIDVTYHKGASADYRIIVYDLDFERFPPSCSYDIADLVRISNECGLITYLVKAIGIGPMIYYEQNEYSQSDAIRSISDLPMEDQLRVEDFWRNYYAPHAELELECIEYENLSPWNPSYIVRGGISKVEWNEKGFFIILNNDKEYIDWLLSHKEKITNEYVQENHPCMSINLNDNFELEVQLNKIPMSELVLMSPEEKFYYGDEIRGIEHIFSDLFDELHDEYEYLNQRMQ